MTTKNSDMDSLGVAVIGTGFMGKCHAQAWSLVSTVFGARPKPRLEVLCDVGDTATRLAPEWNFARATDDWRAVISDPRVDVVSITTPNNLHRDIAVAALEAGKHVWCEKPMAVRLEDAEEMTAAARAAKAQITLLGYNYRQNPALQHAARLIQGGTIGRVIDFRGQVDEDYLADPMLPWSWRMRAEDAGLGTLGDITVHLVSLARLLVGPVARVAAVTETAHRARPLPEGGTASVDTEDLAHAVLRFADGTPGVIGSSRVAHGRKSTIRIEVHGDKGMIEFDQERMNELKLYLAQGPKAERGFSTILTSAEHPPYGRFCPAPGHQLGFNDLKVIEAAHLLACIRGEEKPGVDFAHGLDIERTVHAIAQSAREERWVAVPRGA
jgi:predicted dehydrogenase